MMGNILQTMKERLENDVEEAIKKMMPSNLNDLSVTTTAMSYCGRFGVGSVARLFYTVLHLKDELRWSRSSLTTS